MSVPHSRTASRSGVQANLNPRIQLVRRSEPAKEKVRIAVDDSTLVKPVSFAVGSIPERATIAEHERDSLDLGNHQQTDKEISGAVGLVEDPWTAELLVKDSSQLNTSSPLQISYSPTPSLPTPQGTSTPPSPSPHEPPAPSVPPAPQADLYLIGSGWDLKRKMRQAAEEQS